MNNIESKKVLILSCGTGGGHNSAARAVREYLLEKNVEADFIEYLEITNEKIKEKRVDVLKFSWIIQLQKKLKKMKYIQLKN